jgi:hypothetical protein
MAKKRGPEHIASVLSLLDISDFQTAVSISSSGADHLCPAALLVTQFSFRNTEWAIWFMPGANEVPRLQMSVKQACLDLYTAQQPKTRPDWSAFHRCRRENLAKSPTPIGV